MDNHEEIDTRPMRSRRAAFQESRAFQESVERPMQELTEALAAASRCTTGLPPFCAASS